MSFAFQPDANKVVRSGVVPQMKVFSAPIALLLFLLPLLLLLLLLLLHDTIIVVRSGMIPQMKVFLAAQLRIIQPTQHCVGAAYRSTLICIFLQ